MLYRSLCEAVTSVKDELLNATQVVVEYKWYIVGAAAVSYTVYRSVGKRTIASKLCDLTKTNINDGIRASFGTLRMAGAPPRQSDHSHPISASNRTNAERSIDNFILSIGFDPYSVSTSARDTIGQRLYYTPKDLNLPYHDQKVTGNHILRMIDVDYYADMEQWLWTGRPILVYTFVPETVGGEVIEGTFSITDDSVSVIYDGGGTYTHKLWNYNLDHFVIKGKVYSLMVKVDQVKIPDDSQRRIVLLTPTTWYYSIFNGLFSEIQTLKRRRFTYGEANVTTFHDNTHKRAMVSMSARGLPANVSIPYKTFVGMCLRLVQSKTPMVSDVERYLRADDVEDPAVVAPIIYAAYVGGWYEVNYHGLDKVVDCGIAKVPHYQARGPLLTEDGKDIGVAVFPPIITGKGFFPKSSYNNDVATITSRVDQVKNEVAPSLHGVYHQYMREFINAFPSGACSPWSHDDVFQHQIKPMQKVRNENSKHWIFRQLFEVKSFMKKEAYAKVNDPRNISTCTTTQTVALSAYTYPAKEIFKRYGWYTPGHNPVEIASLVQDLVSRHTSVYSIDYSRLDGSISEFLRMVEKGVYLRMFPKEHIKQLCELLDAEYQAPAKTSHGYTYKPGFSRLSGSPLTTDGNTLISAFVGYCAARNAHLIKAGEIDKIPGLFYGDDGLVTCIDKVHLIAASTALGLTMKLEESKMGQPLTFLARVFVDPWTTSTSMQDPLRTLGKIHLSVVRNVDPKIVANNKARGYLATDRLTPILSTYCNRILKETPFVTDLTIKSYANQLQRDSNWWATEHPNNSWPQCSADIELMQKVMADILKIGVTDLITKDIEISTGEWDPWDYPVPHTAIIGTQTADVVEASATLESPPSKKTKGKGK